MANTAYWPNGEARLKMDIKNNTYGFGERVENLQISYKAGKKLKDKGEAKLVFYGADGNEIERKPCY